MGCSKSKPSREDAEPIEQPQPQQPPVEKEYRQPSLELPKGDPTPSEPLPVKTPMAPKDDSMVIFDKASHGEIDTLLPGEARSKSSLQWRGSCWSQGVVSAGSSRRGVAFRVEPGFVAVGLKAAAGRPDDSYGALDYSFYCMEHGRLQIYEQGEMMYTHASKYSDETVLEIHVRAHPLTVEYIIDEGTVYTSTRKPQEQMHFQICFGDHPAVVTDICYVMTSKDNAIVGGA